MRGATWVVCILTCFCVLIAVGCSGDTPTQESGDEGKAGETPSALAVQTPAQAELPSTAKSVTGADGEVFHYTVDPCAIVPEATAEKFLGRPVATRFSFVYGIPPYTRCEYAAELPEEERTGRSPDRLTVSVVEPLTLSKAGFPGLKDGADAYGRLKDALANADAASEDVPGLGDKAFLQTSDGVLHVLAGDIYLRVSANIYTNQTAPTLDELHKKMAEHNAEVAMRFAEDHLLPSLQTK